MTSLTCAECGTRAEPGQSFCDGCGAVLDWSGRAERRRDEADTLQLRSLTFDKAGTTGGSGTTGAAGGPPAPPGPTAAAASKAAGSAAPGTPAGKPEPSGRAGRGEQAASATPPTPPADPDTTVAAWPDAPGDTTIERAQHLVVPVADPSRATAPTQVTPVLPGRPAPERPHVTRPAKESGGEGGLPCPWCGTPNRPDRHFCARCAMPVAGGSSASLPRPWWRRLFDRDRETPWAGQRPRLRRTLGHVVRWLGVAVVLALLVALAFRIPDAARATRDHFARRTPVIPDGHRASHAFPGHGAGKAFDTYNNTWWGPGVSQSGQGEWLEARFEEPATLLDVVVTPGVSTRPADLNEQALPHRMEAMLTSADGTVSVTELVLDRAPGGQRLTLRGEDVTTVRLTVVSAYGAADDKQVAIAEVEFFGPAQGAALW